jgi:hypothetical protein
MSTMTGVQQVVMELDNNSEDFKRAMRVIKGLWAAKKMGTQMDAVEQGAEIRIRTVAS